MNDKQSDIPFAWHAKSSEEVLQSLETSADGLSDEEARKRLEEYGKNELNRKKKRQKYERKIEKWQ